jgi:hypothetical protein
MYQYHKDFTLPNPEEIFVFGSNLAGIHGAGAAKQALKYGAKYGIGNGFYGNTYAIPTKDENINSMSLNCIKGYTTSFVYFTLIFPHLRFFVTRVGTGLAGFKDCQIAPLFIGCNENCNFPEEWKKYLE